MPSIVMPSTSVRAAGETFSGCAATMLISGMATGSSAASGAYATE
jgi:hypothetical protein